ncbi:glycosyltransferase [Acidobacteria bacterium AB60]|nr:glycosyltransferase [Acidobacteria bacterium AB60]
MSRILFATIGSLGDLHPCLALGLDLQRRGHHVTIAATPWYRKKVESLGIAFAPVRPDWDPTSGELIAQCANIRRGPEILIRKMILPHLRDTYADLLIAAQHVDLMIAGELVYAAPLVAEKLRLPWASAILSPCSFFSAHDPSLLVSAPELLLLRNSGLRVNRAILQLSRILTESWWTPIRALRCAEGLSPGRNPLLEDKFALPLVLAMFSPSLAASQPDWPTQTVQTGFVFFDRPLDPSPESERILQFLAGGDPPVVFTQGSTAVHHPGAFYRVSIDAARSIGRRALLIGASPQEIPAAADVLAVPYASYAEIFPRAAAIVHQGGAGTTGQAMRAGRPQLFVPFGWDQPDHAARLGRRNCALTLARARYTPERAARALRTLLEDAGFRQSAAAIQKEMQAEEGLSSACNAIETLLREASATPDTERQAAKC